MGNTQQPENQNAMIQGLIGRYLELRSGPPVTTGHLDDDTINAFTEGRLSEREAFPIVSHLSECSFCRHITAEMVKLDLEFGAVDTPVTVRESSEPASVSSVLSGILSRIFGTGEAAVFAHEEQEEDDEEEDPK